jgi:hypothetical protein
MNCKQGDIAIVVRSETGLNFGKIVTCLRLASKREVDAAGLFYMKSACWITDRPTFTTSWDGSIGTDVVFPDCNLKPLRGDEEQDDITETTDLEVAA